MCSMSAAAQCISLLTKPCVAYCGPLTLCPPNALILITRSENERSMLDCDSHHNFDFAYIRPCFLLCPISTSPLRSVAKVVILLSTSSTFTLFVHIQKTGGTLLERRLAFGGVQLRPCICFSGIRRCQCRTKRGITWLVSRYSTGWICGLHAGLTEYSQCINRQLNIFDSKAVKRNLIQNTSITMRSVADPSA
ncbi:unnamed protein product [Dicrocoelium dendriticum]|nr:unnamed protein product [Dicrocoelium dendriticum]